MLIKYEYISTYGRHSSAHLQFHKQFIQNKFGYACRICDRLCFESNVKNLIHDSVEFVRTFLQNVLISAMLHTTVLTLVIKTDSIHFCLIQPLLKNYTHYFKT